MRTLKEVPVDEQPTKPIEVMGGKQQHRLPAMFRLIMLLILSGLLLVGILSGEPAGRNLFSFFSGITTKASHLITHPRPAMARSPVANLIAHQFMEAMMHKDWSDMWSMLHPDAQQAWQGEEDFIHFEQVKFGALKFTAYKDTAARMHSSWLDPNNTLTYPKVQTLRISLQMLAPKGLLTEPSNTALEKGLFDNTLFAVAPYHHQWRVLVAGPADLEAPILVPASPPALKLLVPIFMYHHISNQLTQNLLDYGLTVRTVDFDEQLTWLQNEGYHSITQTELFDALYYGKILPPHPMILTFDDGYEDAYTDALPVLLAHHYRGVFYIITSMIGGRYMLWDQVRTLARDGMQISSHTVHHVNVGEPPYGTSTQFELTVAKSTLEKELGQPIQFFCYPSGEPFHHDKVVEQQVVLADLFADGYVSATLDPFRYNSAIQDARLPYELNRIRVSGGESLDAFIGIFNYTLKTGTEELGQAQP